MTLAEDQLAEAFARAWASWPKVSRHPAPRAWVVRTALNAGASWWQRRSKETALTSHDTRDVELEFYRCTASEPACRPAPLPRGCAGR